MKDVVYFSGVHGSGKSTLISALQERNEGLFILSDKPKLPKTQTAEERQLVRLCRSYIQALQQRELAMQNPERIVLADRSCIDPLPYAKGFERIGWVQQGYYEMLRELHAKLFTPDHIPKRIVFVNPPLDFVKDKIQKRWQETGTTKWNEDNIMYLQAVHESYQEILSLYDCLELKETDLDARVQKVTAWIGR